MRTGGWASDVPPSPAPVLLAVPMRAPLKTTNNINDNNSKSAAAPPAKSAGGGRSGQSFASAYEVEGDVAAPAAHRAEGQSSRAPARAAPKGDSNNDNGSNSNSNSSRAKGYLTATCPWTMASHAFGQPQAQGRAVLRTDCPLRCVDAVEWREGEAPMVLVGANAKYISLVSIASTPQSSSSASIASVASTVTASTAGGGGGSIGVGLGSVVREWREVHKGSVYAMSSHKGSGLLASGSNDKSVRVGR